MADVVAPDDVRQVLRAKPTGFALVLGFFLIAAVPFFLTAMPPVMDFPNHIARIWLLAGGADIPPLSSMYQIRWDQASTNILIDYLAASAARLFPLIAIEKILLLLMFLGPPLAAASLNRAVFGRSSIWQIAGIALIWNATATSGFLNFHIGLAAALVCAQHTMPFVVQLSVRRLAGIGTLALLLLLIHPFGALFFLLLMVGFVIGPRLLPYSHADVKQRLRRLIPIACACILPVVLLFLFAAHPPGAHGTHDEFMHWMPWRKMLAPKHIALIYFAPFISYDAAFDTLLALPFIAVIIWAAVRGQLKVHSGLVLMAVMLEAVSPLLPMNVGDGGAFNIRVPIMAMLMGFAGIQPAFSKPRTKAAMAVILASAALLRIASIGWVWHERAKDFDDLQTASRVIPAGASVMVLEQKWNEDKRPLGRLVAGFPDGACAAERHFGSLLVMWRHVFVPTMFTVPGQQPLAVKPPWKAKSVYLSGIPFANDIDSPGAQRLDPYLVDWQKKFDYVVVLNADLGRQVLKNTRLVADRGFARVYQVVR